MEFKYRMEPKCGKIIVRIDKFIRYSLVNKTLDRVQETLLNEW